MRVLDQQRDASGRADNQPVAGVSITVVDADGNEVGTAVTDAEGTALIVVPERADYVVRLDESTLPDDLGLTGESTAEEVITPSSFITSTTIITFFTGESQSAGQAASRRSPSASPTASGSAWSSPCARSGLSLIFGTTGLTNFAHGEMVTFGGDGGVLAQRHRHRVPRLPAALRRRWAAASAPGHADRGRRSVVCSVWLFDWGSSPVCAGAASV